MPVDKLVLWDIDGTLLHCGSDGKKALNKTFLKLYGISNAFDKAHIGGSMDSMIIDGILATFGIDKTELPRIRGCYREALVRILDKDENKRVLPGVLELLEELAKDPSVVNGLLTSNLKIGAEAKLSSLGLCEYFVLGCFGDEPGEKWDAALRCIDLAEDLYKTYFPKKQIYIIGDSCYDILCAKKVGISSIAVATGWTDPETLMECSPDYFFSDLSDTERILEIING